MLSVCLTLCNITLEALLETAEIVPHVNQILLAPGCDQKDLVAYAKSAISFLKPIVHRYRCIFGNEHVKAVAERNGKSVAQVALRWSLQKGFLPLPKSVTPKNIKANLDIFDFDLSEEDMAVLDKIQGIKTQDDPDTVNF